MNRFEQRCIIFILLLSLFATFYMAFLLSTTSNDARKNSAMSLKQKNNCPPCREKDEKVENTPRPEHLLCIVVPFRDRFTELLEFAPEIHAYLSKKNFAHRILIVQQTDVYRFNRASLINVGYYESRRQGCDYLAMHDVDLIPLNLDLDYGYPNGGPYHVAAPKYHPRYHYEKFIGGILILTLVDYERVNGMSNKYWGWGLEDDEFYLRLKDAKMKINRPENLSTNSTNTFRHVHNKKTRKRDMARIGDQKKESLKRDRKTGLDTLIYEIENRISLQIENASVTIVNVKLTCDKSFTPWCQFEE